AMRFVLSSLGSCRNMSRSGDGLRWAWRMASVLDIRDLHVAYRSREGSDHLALAGVSVELLPSEILGILGESGSGKSTLAGSLVRLLPGAANIVLGTVR